MGTKREIVIIILAIAATVAAIWVFGYDHDADEPAQPRRQPAPVTRWVTPEPTPTWTDGMIADLARTPLVAR